MMAYLYHNDRGFPFWIYWTRHIPLPLGVVMLVLEHSNTIYSWSCLRWNMVEVVRFFFKKKLWGKKLVRLAHMLGWILQWLHLEISISCHSWDHIIFTYRVSSIIEYLAMIVRNAEFTPYILWSHLLRLIDANYIIMWEHRVSVKSYRLRVHGLGAFDDLD